MKLSIALVSLFFTAQIYASADSYELQPEELCQIGKCTENMKSILEKFISAEKREFVELSGYSGTCYHIHPNYNPEDTHHGLLRILKEEDGLKFSGLFSFFAKNNPYADLSLKEVDDLFTKRGSKKHPVLAKETHHSVRIATANNPPIFYWFKTTEESAYLLSKWEFQDPRVDVRIFCELNSHSIAKD